MNILNKIIEVLQTQTGPITLKYLKSLAKVRNQILIRGLKEIISSGKVVRTGLGKKKNPFHYALINTEHEITDSSLSLTQNE